jgi:hypothetical protein
MRRVVALTALILVTATPVATAQAPAAPPPSIARLQGTFELAGRVTVAVNVRGEHKGETVTRFWTFTPLCDSGPCPTITLVRGRRLGASDTLTLYQKAPAHYVGHGAFYAPLRCNGQIYPQGERVPFAVTVTITKAFMIGGVVVAARVSARYINHRRVNLTPCVMAPSHDAASYHGHLVLS